MNQTLHPAAAHAVAGPRVPWSAALAWVGWMTMLAAGCSPVADPPDLRRVVPDFGWTGEVTNITIDGQDLFPEVVVGDHKDEAQFNSSFQVFLEADPQVELDAVQFVDASTLTAEVPAGVAPGRYAVQVVTPSGQADTLDDGFRVTETRADHLSFDVADVSYGVTETASVGIYVADPEGGNVAQPILVEVRAESDAGAAGVQFSDGLLDNQTSLDDGVGVKGNLHADGTATLLLQSSVAQDLTLTVAAIDEPTIGEDTTLLSFSPGVPNQVVFTLPSDDFSTVAGDEVDVSIDVVDASGNMIDATGLSIVVFEDAACGELREVVDLLEAGPYPLVFTTACEANHLHAFGIGIDQAESEAFDVIPGPAAGYGVTAAPTSVVAGRGVLAVQVDAEDAYGNLVADHVAQLYLHDSVGGLDAEAGIGSQTCDAFSGGTTVCTATPIRAASAITITAADDGGLTGVSNPISVSPSSAVAVTMTVGVAAAEAGATFTVGLQLVDEWENPITFSADLAVFADSTGTLSCSPSAEGNYICSVTASDGADVISVDLEGLSADSPPFEVTNTDLTVADVTVAETAVIAGQTFGVTIHGFDAYGNAYTTPVSGSGVSVVDSLGGMAPLPLVLDATGAITSTVGLTVAGDDLLVATAAGAPIGQSTPIKVSAATVMELAVTAPPWANVDDGVPIEVAALDAWGNASSTYASSVSVSMSGCTGVVVSDFSSGAAEADLSCVTPGFDLVVTADDGSTVSSSQPVDLLDFDCSDGPAASLLLNGDSSVVACLVAGETTLSVDTSGSAAGGATLAVWHLDDGETDSRSTSAPSTLVFDTAGGRAVTLVVADTDACAAQTTADAWIGENDGTAVGPITLTPTSTSVANGASATVSLAATDCAGDIAAAADLYVWSTLGVVTGTSTGSGLTVTLDGAGTGAIRVSFTAGYAGDATVEASSADGSGFGSTAIAVTGDAVRPTVLAASPAGAWTDPISTLTIDFSEPLLASSVTLSSVTLVGPDGAVALSLALADADRSVVITPVEPVDPTTGVFTLSVLDTVRDVAGNRLSGDWSSAPADWTSTFGDVAVTVASTNATCAFSPTSFRPDGDDGSGGDADGVAIALTAAVSPAWWAVSVTDADLSFVRRTFVDGSGLALSWDGRGDDGVIQPEGRYDLAVTPIDTTGNAGTACSASVMLTQHGRAP